MAKSLFSGLDKAKQTSESLKNQLAKMESQNSYNFKHIPYSEIKPSEKNKYPMEKVEELKESIKSYGLIHNLVIAPIEETEEGHKYEIISGEQRYRAICRLIEEGDTTYKAGIPCKVESKDKDDIDREIILIEANEKGREKNPARTRAMVERLEELLRMKELKGGEVTRKISETLDIGDRQAQRYKKVNNELIPELQQAFDESKLTLEKAAQIASYPEEIQREIAEILKTSNSIKKSEIDIIEAQVKEREEELKRSNNELREKMKELESLEKANNVLQEELENKKLKIEEIEKNTNDIKDQIRKEMEEQSPDREIIDSLEMQLQQMEDKYKNSKNELIEIENQRKDRERVVDSLNKKIKELEKEKSKNKLSEEERVKLKAEYEINNIMDEIKKGLNLLLVKNENYKKSYGKRYDELENFYNRIIDKIENDQTKI